MRKSARSRVTVGVVTAALLTLSAVAAALQKRASVITQDKGRFTIQLDGQTVGHEEFEISASPAGWAAQGTT